MINYETAVVLVTVVITLFVYKVITSKDVYDSTVDRTPIAIGAFFMFIIANLLLFCSMVGNTNGCI